MTRGVYCVTVCDRCHKQVREERNSTAIARYWYSLATQGDTVVGRERQYDLCTDCMAAVDKVLRTKPDEKA